MREDKKYIEMLGRIDERTEIILSHVSDHNARITSLENDRDRVKGMLLGVSIGSGGVGALLAKILPFSSH